MSARIITSHNAASLWPSLFWCAWREVDEDQNIRGYGRTEQGAIDDLLEQEAEDEE